MARRGLWTGLRLEEISRQLKRLDLSVSPNTARRLLGELDYALHANRKSLSGPQSPERDRQFHYIQEQRAHFVQEGLPIVSVDSKKRELVGDFKNAGQVWSREATPVNDHDFPSQAKGIALPRALYDLQANRGSVVVGTSHDTPDFAATALVQWWHGEGRRRYRAASHLLVLADGGGSNSARSRRWKCALQEKLVDTYQLTVTVCHYPTGASKWNPVEHRFLCEISKHWAGQPLTDYPTIVRLIGGTKTKTGLRTHCELDTRVYSVGLKATDEEMDQLNLQKHLVLPEWNYTLYPRNSRN